MNTDIEKLIRLAVEGGSISDRQREIILRKAQVAGEDLDEVEFYIKIALAEAKHPASPEPDVSPSKELVSSEQSEGSHSEKPSRPTSIDNQEYKPVVFPAPPVEDKSFLGKNSNMFGIKKGCLLWIIIGFGLLIIGLLQNLIDKL